MSGLHSRRLSATADINYGDLDNLASTSNNRNKPLPPIILQQKQRNGGASANNDNNNNNNNNNIKANGAFDDEDFEDFNIDDEDYENEIKRGNGGGSISATLFGGNGSAGDGVSNKIASTGYLYSIMHPTPDTLTILACTFGWYLFSVTISLYNKWMFDKGNLNLPFPIIITSFHQLTLFWLSFGLIYFIPSLRPPPQAQQQQQQQLLNNNTGDSEDINDVNAPLQNGPGLEAATPMISPRDRFFRISDYLMSRKLYLVSIVPCALASSGDIGCGNVSFRFITLSLYTMIKSSSIAFVLIFGVLFKLEKLTFKLVSIVVVMTAGVMMMVAGSTNDQQNGDESVEEKNQQNADLILGSFLVLLASCMSGLRWALTQLVLKKNQYVNNPVSTIFYLSPIMFTVLFVVGSVAENLFSFLQNEIWQQKGFFKTAVLLLVPGFLVFFMTLFELKLLQKSHVVTLSIAGIFKELLTIIVSSLIFGDKLTVINCFGLIVTLMDIVWYNYYRFIESKQTGEKVQYQKVVAGNSNTSDIELRHV